MHLNICMLIFSQRGLRMIIEIKEMDRGRLMAKLCVDLIRRYDMMDRCCVASFNPMSIYFVYIPLYTIFVYHMLFYISQDLL